MFLFYKIRIHFRFHFDILIVADRFMHQHFFRLYVLFITQSLDVFWNFF